MLIYILLTFIESKVYTGISQGLFPKVLGGTISPGYETWLNRIIASLNPETEAPELIISGTTHDASFHLIPTIPASLNLGVPFITLIDE